MGFSFSSRTPARSEILRKYLKMAGLFQNIGIALLAAAILVHLVSQGKWFSASMVLALPGALSLVFGGSSLQPHNLAKSFAQQCSQMPTREMAEAFLEVLEREKKLSLTKASIRIIQNGIETYASQPDADPELVQALRAGAETRINVKFL
ncbi:MAG: hypothetical protein IIY55_11155 [Blautia sp.]|nr:hypothetical protein [Blautia sp.]